MLKAIAEKLIPGIPVQTRISILQQTDADSKYDGDKGGGGDEVDSMEKRGSKLSTLEEVIDRATSRSEIQHEINSRIIYKIIII